jgi:hypothetical protein
MSGMGEKCFDSGRDRKECVMADIQNKVKKAFILVGHENFGKSKTIVQLTGKKNSSFDDDIVKERSLFLFRKSNDDKGEGLLTCLKGAIEKGAEYMLIASCPVFNRNETDNGNTREILKTLQESGYEIYAFILKESWNATQRIEDADLAALKPYCQKTQEATSRDAQERAKELRQFILENK